MTWFQVDSSFYDAEDVVRAGDAVLGALLRLEAYAAHHGLDRVVPMRSLRVLGVRGRLLSALLESGFVESVNESAALRLVAPFFKARSSEEVLAARRKAVQRRIPEPVRDEVLRRDGLVCGLCNGAVKFDDVHLDHIVPVCRGGASVADNLRVTHSACNMERGDGT